MLILMKQGATPSEIEAVVASDGFQSLRLDKFRILMERIRELAGYVGRTSPEEVSAEVR